MAATLASTTTPSSTDVLPRDEQFLRALPWVFAIVGLLRLGASAFGLAVVQFQRMILGSLEHARPTLEAAEPSMGSLFETATSVHALVVLYALWGAVSGTVLLVGWKAVSKRTSHARALLGAVALAIPTSSELVSAMCVACGVYAVVVLLKPSVKATFSTQAPQPTPATQPAAS